MRKDLDYKPRPLNSDISREKLIIMLLAELNTSKLIKKIKKIFCWHKWIYWKYGDATKLHRICKKCYKKQRNKNVISKGIDFWEKDKKIMLNPQPKEYNGFY